MYTDTEAYKEWIDIFDSDVSIIWNTERKELQRAAMLLGALQKEFKRVHDHVNLEYCSLRKQLNNKGQLREKNESVCLKKSPNLNNKENELLDKRPSLSLKNSSKIESPDLFRNHDINKDLKSERTTNSSVIDLSLSDDEKTSIDSPRDSPGTSPTLISKLRKHKSKLPRISKPNLESNQFDSPVPNKLFKTRKSDLDYSFIDCTPDLKTKKSDSRLDQFLSKKKMHRSKNTSTLTQMFANTSKHKPLTIEKIDNGIDSDETRVGENRSKSKMSITDLLEFINKDETEENIPENLDDSELEEMDSMQELDQFSKGGFLDDNTSPETSPSKHVLRKQKLVEIEPEPIVRGHARKLLNGFSCKECRDFYAHMNLSPEELKKKIDECSKHRFTHRPPDDTLPGFWDMTIPSQH